jgi:hypothetical protein
VTARGRAKNTARARLPNQAFQQSRKCRFEALKKCWKIPFIQGLARRLFVLGGYRDSWQNLQLTGAFSAALKVRGKRCCRTIFEGTS